MSDQPANEPKRKAEAEADRLAIPLDPEEALRALLKVDPESEPVADSDSVQRPPKDSARRGHK